MRNVHAESLEADFFVDPGGDDASPGTEEQPFATLERARDAVRQLRDAGTPRDVLVFLRGGDYRLTETVVFTLEDSAPQGHTITYAAYPGETPVISSGYQVQGWRRADRNLRGLPPKARGHIWSAACPDDVDRPLTLYEGFTRLPRSRSKGFLPPNKAKTYKAEQQSVLRYPKDAVLPGPNLNDWEIVCINAAPWSMNILPVKALDAKNRVVRTAARGSYVLSQPRFGDFSKSAWIENAFSGLDEPGEWVFDSDSRTIYLWPKNGAPGANILVPSLTELLRVEGDIDYEGPTDHPVRGLAFQGITFARADRFAWRQSGRGYGLQHDWEVFDASTAMVRLRGAEDCVVKRCRFVDSGATALRLDLHCKRNRVFDNEIANIGGAGIVLAGYGPGTKDVNRENQITQNHIHNIGQLYWHSPGIIVWQSGNNLVANNLVHHTPYTGIVVCGRIVWNRKGNGDCVRTIRWSEIDAVLGTDYQGRPDWKAREPFLHARHNRVQRNEIHHVMEKLSDGNGIYVSGAGGGNLVQENYIHDCPSKLFLQAIRCDDDQHETTIDRNVIWRIGGWAEFIIIKGRNDVTGNVCALPLRPPKRGMLVLNPDAPGSTDGSVVQRNVFYTRRKGDKLVYQQANSSGFQGRLHRCDADSNLYFNAADASWGKRHLQAERRNGSEPNSLADDPRFRNVKRGNFELRKDSPLTGLGFVPIDLRAVGLRPAEEPL